LNKWPRTATKNLSTDGEKFELRPKRSALNDAAADASAICRDWAARTDRRAVGSRSTMGDMKTTAIASTSSQATTRFVAISTKYITISIL